MTPKDVRCQLALAEFPLKPLNLFVSNLQSYSYFFEEGSGSVVECLTKDQRAVGSSLSSVTALWSLSKTHLP